MDYIMVSNIVLACHLAVIAWVDFTRHIIPDLLNLSLAICGLAVSVLVLDKTVANVLLVSGLTMVIFLLISKAYNILRAKRGIGMGDIKFLGAAAIWVGLMGIPWTVLLASISGLLFVVVAGVSGREIKTDSRIAFGPHLALGLFAAWLLRDMLAVQI